MTQRTQSECGWSDAGEAMIALAGPDAARVRWAALLETDGGYLDGVRARATAPERRCSPMGRVWMSRNV